MSTDKLARFAPIAAPNAAMTSGETSLEAMIETESPVSFDVTAERQMGLLRAQAMRCRRLAQSVTDSRSVDTMLTMADEYDAKVQSLRPS